MLKIVEKHEEDAREKRAKALMDNLAARLASVERKLEAQPEIDLAIEFLGRAIRDDDERKLSLHAAFVGWFVTAKRPVARARLLSEAIQRLTWEELLEFRDRHGRKRNDGVFVTTGLDEQTLYTRLAAAGLWQASGVRMPQQITPLGESLLALVDEVSSNPGGS